MEFFGIKQVICLTEGEKEMREKNSAMELPEAYAKIIKSNFDKSEEIIISAKGETSEKAFELFQKIKAEVEIKKK